MTMWAEFQNRCRAWAMECLGYAQVYDDRERAHRMLEEAVELFQSMGCGRAEAHAIVDWKMDGRVGDLQQEVGGLLICISVLCSARAIDMASCGESELASAYERIPDIRAKQIRKPRFAHLWGAR